MQPNALLAEEHEVWTDVGLHALIIACNDIISQLERIAGWRAEGPNFSLSLSVVLK